MESTSRGLSNEELIAELDRLRRRELEGLPDLLACLSELERRRAYIALGYSTLFDYCVGRLRYSEGAAMRRIRAARAASRFHSLYVMIRDGQLSLSAVSRLEAHWTSANFDSVVSRAVGKPQREIEAIIVEIISKKQAAAPPAFSAPQEPPTMEISLFEAATPSPAPPKPSDVLPRPPAFERPRDSVRLESPGVVRFSFQASEKLRRDLDRLKELLKRSCESGRLEEILEKVIVDFLERNDPVRRPLAPARAPRLRQTRRIPRWVRDRVWRRDEARCAFVSADGRRCGGRGGLELDHIVPWARGGSSDDPANIRLLCRAHNLHLARGMFGSKVPQGAAV
jgi:hypothetical protein